MDITQWYAIALGSILFFSVILWVLRCIFRLVITCGYLPFLKYIAYPQLINDPLVCGRTTCFHAILILGLLTSNALFIALQRPNIEKLISRSGLMSTINLIFLSLGNYMNFLFTDCSIASQDYDQIHR